MVKLTKMVFEIKLCDDIKINSKHFWGFVRSKPNLKERILNVKKWDESLTSGDVETANEFNKAFHCVFVVEDGFNSDYSYWGRQRDSEKATWWNEWV